MIDLEKAVTILGIEFLSSGDKHCTQGWIQFSCPYCKGEWYLGWNIDGGYFHCWSCGGVPVWKTLNLLSKFPLEHIQEICNRYTIGPNFTHKPAQNALQREISLPTYTNYISDYHRAYLLSRGFDPKEIEERYQIRGSEHLGEIRWSIFIPIYWEGIMVSWIARSIKKKSEFSYMFCPPEPDALSVKNILYGWDFLYTKKAVLVEGVLDMWKLGPGAIASFGVTVTSEQIKWLSTLDSIYIMFDSDVPGIRRAKKLAKQLASIMDVEVITLDTGDPGDLSRKEARKIMEELGFV